jgi:hypothetical protein
VKASTHSSASVPQDSGFQMNDDSMTGSGPVAGRHQVDVEALTAWLVQQVPGFRGPLTVEAASRIPLTS